jgi:hypothetical protein
MIDEIELCNFRSFSQQTIRDCRRINIIVGDNGSGKTAFLEGAFLAAGASPEIALRARAWRGAQGGRLEGTEEEIEQGLWVDLFYNFQISKPAFIGLRSRIKDHTRSVTITFDEKRRTKIGAAQSGIDLLVRSESPMAFTWAAPFGFKFTCSPFLYDGQMRVPPGPASRLKTTFFAANHTYSAGEIANRFSQLSKASKEREFISLFGQHFKEVSDLIG